MKVKDLIELLKEYNENAEVLMTDVDADDGYRYVQGADEDQKLDMEYGTYFMSSYGDVDVMTEGLAAGVGVDEVLAALVDVVVLY